MSQPSLRLTEIFYSLQGESSLSGLPTVFIRLTGCPLRCVYCDTAYAFEGGQRWTFEAVLEEVAQYGPRYVCVTGGEPLAQPECLNLLSALCDEGYVVSLETSGAISVEGVDSRVLKIMDLKTPSSEESSRNLWSNLDFLNKTDQIKFVVGSDDDFDWLEAKCLQYQLPEKVDEILVSPVYGSYSLEKLAERILQSPHPMRMQMQLHKLIWNDAQGK
ncbi:UNVERIFIED_CONTAM: hypothetical protein GTU68_067201 [Idotea baltica]|nr:hypothetical protein [Idotea baltica]